jgi:hypothetical protein
VLTLRWDPNSEAMKTIEKATVDIEFSHAATEFHARTAKHISQENPKIKDNLLEISKQALAKPRLDKQTYSDVNQLLIQTEQAIAQVDMAIAIYGNSFTPETHKWALDVREALSQCITGRISILSIRLCAASKDTQEILRATDRVGIAKLTGDLIRVGMRTDEPTYGG